MTFLLGRVALSAAELLISEAHDRIGQCADDRGCGWLFFDTSKNHSRRWCDMNDCGNRAKQHRHHERRKDQS
ncbi:MAG: CGNR zinc finger domain-containing protein [Chloroflexota bacterium]